nr:tetratricopeptide repeat protein [Chitinivorax sp. B]
MTPSTAAQADQLARYQRFLALDPDNLQLLGDVADLSLSLGQLPLTEQTLRHGLHHHPGDPRLTNLRALLAFQQGDWAEAEYLLSGLLAQQDDPSLRYNLAYACYQQGDYPRVRQLLGEPPLDWAALPQAAILQILTLHQLGELDDAIALALSILPARAGDAELAGELALLYLDNDDVSACQHWAAQALQWQADQPYALVAAGTLSIGQGEPTLARQQFQRVLDRQPHNGRAWSGLGIAHLAMQDLQQGKQALEQAVQHMPEHIGTWHALAWVYLMEGDWAAAEHSFQQAYDLDPNFGESHGGLGVMALLRNDSERAAGLLARARRLAPGSMAVRYAEIIQAQRQGQGEAVQQILQRALADLPVLGAGRLEDVLRQRPARAVDDERDE